MLDMKLLSNLLNVTYLRDPECIEDIDNFLTVLNSSSDIKAHIAKTEFSIEKSRLNDIVVNSKTISKYSKDLLQKLLK